MKEIKKFFTETLSSVWYMGFAVVFGLIAMFMMFAPNFYFSGKVYSGVETFFPNIFNGAWPAFLGYMLVTLGFVATGLMALPIVKPSAKVEKVVLIGSIICELVGLFLVAFIMNEYLGFNNFASSTAYLKGGVISFIVFDSLTICSTLMAAVLDW